MTPLPVRDDIAVEPFGSGIARVNLSLAARVRRARGLVCWEGGNPMVAHLARVRADRAHAQRPLYAEECVA